MALSLERLRAVIVTQLAFGRAVLSLREVLLERSRETPDMGGDHL